MRANSQWGVPKCWPPIREAGEAPAAGASGLLREAVCVSTSGAQALHSGACGFRQVPELGVPCYLQSGNRLLMGPKACKALAGAQCEKGGH